MTIPMSINPRSMRCDAGSTKVHLPSLQRNESQESADADARDRLLPQCHAGVQQRVRKLGIGRSGEEDERDEAFHASDQSKKRAPPRGPRLAKRD